MSEEDRIYNHFLEGFKMLKAHPRKDEKNALLERIIEAAMKMRGVKQATIKEEP